MTISDEEFEKFQYRVSIIALVATFRAVTKRAKHTNKLFGVYRRRS